MIQARVDFPEQAGERLRHCFTAPRACLIARTVAKTRAVIEAAHAEALAGRWVVGFVAYEAAPAFDAALCVRPLAGPLPFAAFAVFDAPQPWEEASGTFHCGPWRIETGEQAAHAAIESLRRRIFDGEFYQVNLTTRLRAAFCGDGAALFDALRSAQPDAYALHLQAEGWEILSVSPELFFDWQPDGRLATRPMKGTAAREADPVRDALAAAALHASAKERAENLMIVDLLRNDVSRIARPGSVRVPELFAVDGLPTVWQMSSTVTCETRPGIGLADVFAALFPCGSVTGAPKVAAMRAIAAVEASPRGAYCGALGVIRPGGHATFAVGIRTVVIDRRRKEAACGIGSGIVFDSQPAGEYAEWLVKRRFLLRATASFELLETLLLSDGSYALRERHLERLATTARHFGFPEDPSRVAEALETLAAAYPGGDYRVRLLLDRQGGVRREIAPLDALPENPLVCVAQHPIAGDPEFMRFKTTHRAAYAPFAPPPGVFDTLLWNADGEITEFTRGNVIVELDGRLITPPASAGLLPGVLRAELLARGEIVEGTIRRADLARASAIWFINSVRGWVKVRLMGR